MVLSVLALLVLVSTVGATTYSYSSGEGLQYSGSTVSWSTIRGYSTATSVHTTGDYITPIKAVAYSSWSTPNTFTQIGRVIVGIDTSAMTDGYNQINPKIYLKQGSVDSAQLSTDPSVHVVALLSPPEGTTGDYDIFNMNKSYGYFNIGDLSSSFLAVNISEDFPFNTEGITYFGFILGDDLNNTMPAPWCATCNNQVNFDRSPAPYLTVDSEESPHSCDIDVSPSSGVSPLPVTFTDKSTGFNYGSDQILLDYGNGDSYSGDYPGYDATRNYIYMDAGTYNYSYRVTHDGEYFYSNGTITVTGDTTTNFRVRVIGLNGSVVSDATVNIWYDGGTVFDTDTTDDFYGTANFFVEPSRFVNGNVTKTGYQEATFTYYVCPTGYCSNEKWVTLYTDNEIPGSGDEYWNYIVTFRDASSLEILDNVFIDVYTDSGRTDLFLSESAPYGVWTGLLPNATTYYFTASAADHVDSQWSYALSGSSVAVYKDMLPVIYGGLEPVLNIFVYDTGGTALKDVGVSVDSDIDDGFHLTNTSGFARHFCDTLAYGSHRDYTITAQKGGYITESSVVNVSTSHPTVYIYMEKSSIATVTPTGIYTPVETPIWSGDGGEPGNIKEQLINTLMTQFGLSQLEANILMGIVLTLLCAVTVGGALASYGSGSGAGVGAMIGAVVGFSGSSIIGFFPIWILIVVIVLVFAAWFMFRGRDE
jgi:hypothetical protein